ncbi:unnamed protein product [Linum trigynum]|uniref:Uncharacterized protein n=1 Tax=Linum trigynum TaxID=586398 RepID=A0AAV2G9X8_9ROSI
MHGVHVAPQSMKVNRVTALTSVSRLPGPLISSRELTLLPLSMIHDPVSFFCRAQQLNRSGGGVKIAVERLQN